MDTLDLFRPESLLDTARLAFGVSAFGKLLVEQVFQNNFHTILYIILFVVYSFR